MKDYLPPHNLEAEEAVIGSVLIDPDAFKECDLAPDDFYLVKHRWVWAVFQTLTARGEMIDLFTVQDELKVRDQLDELGGPAYMTRLLTMVPSALNAAAYAAKVREYADRRAWIGIGSDIAKAAHKFETPLTDAAPEFVQRMIQAGRPKTGAVTIGKVFSDLYDLVQQRADDPSSIVRLPTGFPDMDDRLGGGGKLKTVTVISGEPGKGKTILVSQIADNWTKAGLPGAFYELELSAEQFASRQASLKTSIPEGAIERGQLGDDQWPILTNLVAQMSTAPMFFSDDTRWTTSSLRADLSRLKAQYGIKWFIVDYFRLLKDVYGENKNERDEYMSARLRDIAKDLDLCGLVIHSLNKAGMGAEHPGMEHLSGSGSIPFDADCIMFINDHIPESDSEAYSESLRTVTFEKNRFGKKMAPFTLYARPDVPGFASVEHRHL